LAYRIAGMAHGAAIERRATGATLICARCAGLL
jgi:hypothetical protein